MPEAGSVESRDAVSAGEGVRIAGLDHVVLRVGNLDRAIDFYERVLNCRVERRLEQPKLVQLRAGASLIDLVPASASPGEAEDEAGRLGCPCFGYRALKSFLSAGWSLLAPGSGRIYPSWARDGERPTQHQFGNAGSAIRPGQS